MDRIENQPVMDQVDPETPVLDIVVYPHRSLGPKGFAILMIAIVGVSMIVGGVFMAVGAWPVMGFLGLDVVLIYVAFRLIYRDARVYETVRISGASMEVVKVDRHGKVRRAVLQPYWVSVVIEDPSSRDTRLKLRSHGRSVELGKFLGPEEKQDLADVLREALVRARSAPNLL